MPHQRSSFTVHAVVIITCCRKLLHCHTMFKTLLIAALFLVAVSGAPAAEEQPMPYDFEFQESNANHTITRQETGDAQGVVRGTYTLIDKDGRQRTVTYTADPVNGFNAEIQSNEPGLVSHQPAGAAYKIQ